MFSNKIKNFNHLLRSGVYLQRRKLHAHEAKTLAIASLEDDKFISPENKLHRLNEGITIINNDVKNRCNQGKMFTRFSLNEKIHPNDLLDIKDYYVEKGYKFEIFQGMKNQVILDISWENADKPLTNGEKNAFIGAGIFFISTCFLGLLMDFP